MQQASRDPGGFLLQKKESQTKAEILNYLCFTSFPRLFGKFNFISFAPYGNDHIAVGTQFITQTFDVCVDGSGITQKIIAPDLDQERLPAEVIASVGHEEDQQIKFLGCQSNFLTIDCETSLEIIDFDTQKFEITRIIT